MLPAAFLAGRDAPVGDAAVEILPELFLEFRLGAVERVNRGVGLDRHCAVIGRLRHAARQSPGPEVGAPLLERLPRALRARRGGDHERGEAAGQAAQDMPAGHWTDRMVWCSQAILKLCSSRLKAGRLPRCSSSRGDPAWRLIRPLNDRDGFARDGGKNCGAIMTPRRIQRGLRLPANPAQWRFF